jgi:hypothetical protein
MNLRYTHEGVSQIRRASFAGITGVDSVSKSWKPTWEASTYRRGGEARLWRTKTEPPYSSENLLLGSFASAIHVSPEISLKSLIIILLWLEKTDLETHIL